MSQLGLASLTTPLKRLALWGLRSPAVVDREIDAELDFHLDCLTEELIVSGLAPGEAREQAARRFGVRTSIRRECQAIGYGNHLRLLVVLAGVCAVSLGIIGWMGHLLQTARRQHEMAVALLAEARAGDDDARPAAPLRTLEGAVTDAKGNPLEGARILLIFKSWPNEQYRQQSFDAASDAEGKFAFPDLYSTTMQTAFLVTVVADGHAMQSEYVLNRGRKVLKPLRFRLKPAIDKEFVLVRPDGRPFADVGVFPASRKPMGGKDEFVIYHQSGEAAGYRTDADGRIRMNLFAEGDDIELTILDGDDSPSFKFKIDAQPVQHARGEARTGVVGTVRASGGAPLAQAKVLLIAKTWPNGQFHMAPDETQTDAQGSFAFPAANDPEQREALLVSVLHDGFVWQSRYLLKQPGETFPPWDFQLQPAIAKTIVLRDGDGQPLTNTDLAISGRVDADNVEHLIYAVSAASASFTADDAGRIPLNHFAVGDQAKLSVTLNSGVTEVEFTIDDQPEQIVDVGGS